MRREAGVSIAHGSEVTYNASVSHPQINDSGERPSERIRQRLRRSPDSSSNLAWTLDYTGKNHVVREILADAADVTVDAWQDYFRKEGRPFSFFDSDYYIEQWKRCGGDSSSPVNAFAHWIEHGAMRRIVPTRYFDDHWYSRTYSNLLDDGRWSFEHYLLEGRFLKKPTAPTPWFVPRNYVRSIGETVSLGEAYEHFMAGAGGDSARPLGGINRWTLMPSEGDNQPPRQVASVLDVYKRAVELTMSPPGRDLADHTALLARMFIREFYNTVAGLDPDTTAIESFAHFVQHGYAAGLPPTPLFDPRLASELMGCADDEATFRTWLHHDDRASFLPTTLIDRRYCELSMRRLNLDGADDMYVHFITRGAWAGVEPNAMMNHKFLKPYGRKKAPGLAPAHKYLLFAPAEAETILAPWQAPRVRAYRNGSTWPLTATERYYSLLHLNLLWERLESPALREVMDRAIWLEPRIGQSNIYANVNVIPYRSPLAGLVSTLRRRLERSRYDNVVTIPHCRMSGAAMVAGSLCRALRSLFPDQSLLLVRTEGDMFQHPEWFPAEMDTVDVSDLTANQTIDDKSRIMLDLFIGVQPRRIFNINSSTAWHTILRYGDRLKQWSDLYGYMFCYDVNRDGHRVGMPSMYFQGAIGELRGLFFDTFYLKNELSRTYRLPESAARKIHPIYHSVPGAARDAPHALRLCDRSRLKNRGWRAAWGGRMDRQKRFDLVYAIAPLLPDIEFWCWGKQVVEDDEYDLDALPPNVRYHGAYESFEELPLHEVDFWLYTSQWDGMPSILIEIALRGIATVASDVGGVSELIGDETGYLVRRPLDPQAYAEQIATLIADPAEAVRRAHNLLQLARTRHSHEAYCQALGAVFDEAVEAGNE